jgi:hypothetical protein
VPLGGHVIAADGEHTSVDQEERRFAGGCFVRCAREAHMTIAGLIERLIEEATQASDCPECKSLGWTEAI